MTAEYNNEFIVNFLRDYPPFDSLRDEELSSLAHICQQQEHRAGTVILDGINKARDRLWVVLEGQVGLWNIHLRSDENYELGTVPDEVIVQGGVFGYTVVLHSSQSGPRAVALTDIRLLRIPGDVARPIFASQSGSVYLAKEVASNAKLGISVVGPRIPDTAAEMIRRKPVICDAHLTIQEAAQLMSQSQSSYALVTHWVNDQGVDNTENTSYYGILTDEIIRSQIVAQAKSYQTPIIECVQFPVPVIGSSTPGDDALAQMFDCDLLYLPVINDRGRILGVIHARDFQISPSNSSFQLRRRIADANEIELIDLGSQIKNLAHNLFNESASAHRISSAMSVLYDALVCRAITLNLRNSDLSGDEFVWLSLGSIARREAALNSDLDSAIVIFPDINSSAGHKDELRKLAIDLARGVHEMLAVAGLPEDSNGATAAHAAFTRTAQDWAEQAVKWITHPFENDAMIRASLTLDARSVWGVPQELPIADRFHNLYKYPHTLKFFLDAALSDRARIRTVRNILAWKSSYFDIKKYALLPVINLARWLALWAGSSEINTIARLRYVASVNLIDQNTCAVLIRSFEELSRIRLESQLRLDAENKPITDLVNTSRLSPIDKTVLIQSVHEIASAQKRVANIALYTGLDTTLNE